MIQQCHLTTDMVFHFFFRQWWNPRVKRSSHLEPFSAGSCWYFCWRVLSVWWPAGFGLHRRELLPILGGCGQCFWLRPAPRDYIYKTAFCWACACGQWPRVQLHARCQRGGFSKTSAHGLYLGCTAQHMASRSYWQPGTPDVLWNTIWNFEIILIVVFFRFVIVTHCRLASSYCRFSTASASGLQSYFSVSALSGAFPSCHWILHSFRQ